MQENSSLRGFDEVKAWRLREAPTRASANPPRAQVAFLGVWIWDGTFLRVVFGVWILGGFEFAPARCPAPPTRPLPIAEGVLGN